MATRGVLIAMVLVALSACTSNGTVVHDGSLPIETVESVCSDAAADYGPDFQVAAAFATTVGKVGALQPLSAQPPLFKDLPADEVAILCYLDGPVAKSPPLGEGGVPARNYDRAIVAVVDGKTTLVVAGYRDSLPIVQP